MNTAPHKLLLLGKPYLIIVISILASCNNIPRQAISYIEITSNVPALCKVTDTWGTRLINTPGTVYLDRRHGPARLQCKSNGYQDFTEKDIGGSENKNLYPKMISVTMLEDTQKLQEAPTITSGTETSEINQSIEHVDNITKPIHKKSGNIIDSQENNNNRIFQMNPSHYTLSLFSMKSKKNAVEAIQKNGIKEQATLFSYHKNGYQWHVVTYGDYATVKLAKDAQSALPNNLQSLNPWIRNIGSIHNDIRVSQTEQDSQ